MSTRTQVEHFNCTVEDGIAAVSLSRPERKNPLSFDSYAELGGWFRDLRGADDVSAVRNDLKVALASFDAAADSVNDAAGEMKSASVKVSDTLDGKSASAQQIQALGKDAEKSLEELERTLRDMMRHG